MRYANIAQGDSYEPKKGDFIHHKDAWKEDTGIPLRMSLWVLEVGEKGLVIAPVYRQDVLEGDVSKHEDYLGDKQWKAEAFGLFRRATPKDFEPIEDAPVSEEDQKMIAEMLREGPPKA